jgi:hypothetical protein
MTSNSSPTHSLLGSDVSADTAQHSFLVQSLLPVQVNGAKHLAITQDEAERIGRKVEARVPSAFPEDFPKKPSDQPFALPSCGGTGLFTRKRTAAGDGDLDHREARWPDGCVIGSYQVEQEMVDEHGNKELEIEDIRYAFDPDGNGVETLGNRDRILSADLLASLDSHQNPEAGPYFDSTSVQVVPTLVEASHIPYIPRPLGSTTFTTRNNKPFANTSQSYRVRDETMIEQTHLQRWDGTESQKIAHYHLAPKDVDTRDPNAKIAGYEVPADYQGDVLWTTGFV